MPEPRITLVGAGPGDPDLITRKGLKALQTADVVLYDALAAPELLEEVPEHAPRIYVGKRAGQKRHQQQDISRMLVESALAFGHAVRLKGGDPFVFGRGHEELDEARRRGVPVAVVPGISSAVAVPGAQHIPLTRRGVNESFWVVTGTTSNGELSPDLFHAARTNATVVVLMGLRNLAAIVQVYKAQGRADLPAAAIQSGTTAQEKIALGTVASLEAEVTRVGIGTPALIVIGEVVGLHPAFVREVAQQLSPAA